jgi:hypothetical protein
MDLKKLSKGQKIALAVGAVVLIYLIYRWQSSSTAGTNSEADPNTGTTAGDAVGSTDDGSDYASLAGQEQSDVAALQGQNTQTLGQEQSDVGTLGSDIAGLGTQEQSDVGTLGSQITGLAATIPAAPDLSDIDTQIAALSMGVTQLNRAQAATVTTHAGGPFYNYYKQVTGKAPPARVQASNFVYQAWKGGVKAAALKPAKPAAHPSAPKQTAVAHPNPTHQQKSNVSKKLPAPKPPPPKHKPAPPARKK